MSNDSCNLPLDTDVFGLTCIYGVIFSLGLPSNLLSLWGLYHLGRSGGGGCQLVYILNLLLSDLLQLLTLPLWILYLQGAHRWPYGQLPCELVGYVFHVNIYASVMFLCLIALDRCLAIVYPLSSRRVRTVRVAAVCGVVVWMLTFLFCLSGLLPSVFDADRLLCLEQYPVSPGYAYFKITTVALGFLLPCAILGPCELERSIFLVYRLCYGLTSLNTLLDPLFYIFLCPDARSELQRSLSCLGSRQNARKKIRQCQASPRQPECE
ncbi:unnamed protein product [Tetraodon nigroviridis]|uniref:(spotted green pufferfish) hypothetical protein n=1 Tax=Tetraodon nigroviridis TaxID=99883 RepID=Q4RFX7_TETNG|nr:unnamed protein product [Tetraodon nigroviridis]